MSTTATDPSYRGYASDDIVTGEGVAVELPVATVAHRFASGAIDVFVNIVGFLFAGWVILTVTGEASEAVISTGMLIAVIVIFIGVPTTVETLTRGRTLGKLVLGLRVVRDDGGPITARHALVRALVGWVEIYLVFGVAALVTSLMTTRAKRLGDLAAGTFVVTERPRMRLPMPPPMPPELAGWAAGADTAGLPDGLALAVRQFLVRAPSMTAVSRDELGRELLGALLPLVSPAPPPGHHPESILCAVLAERRRRDTARLQRDDALRSWVIGPDPLR